MRKFYIPALLFILCFMLYGNTLHNEYACDDKIYTFSNKFIKQGFSSFKDIWDKNSVAGMQSHYYSQYRPLTLLSFMTEVYLFGLYPHISHFFNVLFFAFTTVLLYFFLQKILKNYNPVIIIAAALLFAFHPIHTEAVANIKSRDEILGFFFGMLSFYSIMLYQDKNKLKYYFFSLLALFLSFFCKESCVTFTFIIPLLLYFFPSRGLESSEGAAFKEIKKIVLATIPFLGIAAVYLLIRSYVMKNADNLTDIPMMDNSLMAAANGSDRLATILVLLGKYLYMLFIPYPLSWDYSYNQIPIESWANFRPLLSLSICVALTGIALWGFRKRNIYSFLIMYLFITLLVSINLIVTIPVTFAERVLYSPSLSFCVVLPILIAGILKIKPILFYILLGCLLSVYSCIIIPRNEEWKNDYTLYSAGVLASPNSFRTHNELAKFYNFTADTTVDAERRRKYYSLAIPEYKKSIKILSMPYSYLNLAICYNGEGYPDSAIIPYKKAMEMNNNYSPGAAYNVGLIYIRMARYDSALPCFMMAYKANSTNLYALGRIVLCEQNLHHYSLSYHYDSLLLRQVPDKKQVLTHLASLHDLVGVQYLKNNKLDSALKEFNFALGCDSSTASAYANIGEVYLESENFTKAREFLQKALLKDPNNMEFKKSMDRINPKH